MALNRPYPDYGSSGAPNMDPYYLSPSEEAELEADHHEKIDNLRESLLGCIEDNRAGLWRCETAKIFSEVLATVSAAPDEPAHLAVAALVVEPEDTSDKPPMLAPDYAKQWARDTLSGMVNGHRFPWGERNLARSYLALTATVTELVSALKMAQVALAPSVSFVSMPPREGDIQHVRDKISAAIAKAGAQS